MLPPIITRQAGRPKHNRIKGHDEHDNDKFEKRNQKRCNKCGGFGHNIRTCQGGPIASKNRSGGELEVAMLQVVEMLEMVQVLEVAGQEVKMSLKCPSKGMF